MPTKTPDNKIKAAKRELTIHLPDTRGVIISRWGKGNEKLGMDGLYTYSRLPGSPDGRFADAAFLAGMPSGTSQGTCPGSTEECETICYAKRVVNTPVWGVWEQNNGEQLPWEDDPLPADAKVVRIHVSGDFDTKRYIEEWIALATKRHEVMFFGYTRSWRVAMLLPGLERFRALPNVQLFASMDKSMEELPPEGWRRAWLEDDLRAISGGGPGAEEGLEFFLGEGVQNFKAVDGEPVYVCPEETGRKPNCQSCNYCISGATGDVVFLVH